MATVDQMSDVFTPLLSTSAKSVVIPSTTMSELGLGFDALLPAAPSRRTTEPLGETGPLIEDAVDVLLDDSEMIEEGNDTDALEGLPVHSLRARTTTTRQALGSEDAFQSY